METWPIDWPPQVVLADYDQYLVQRAEEAAANTLRMLTLYRVGGLPITVMPRGQTCTRPLYAGQYGHSYVPFYPILLSSGMYANCFCSDSCDCGPVEWVYIMGPVGRIDSVIIDGVTVPPSAYHMEGNKLVRTDGGTWPACAGDSFTVTYMNGYPVDTQGQQAAGFLAYEFLKLFSSTGQCRLPRGTEAIAHMGTSLQIDKTMFPGGMTGLDEVDLYLTRWNPNGLKVPPTVTSPDMPDQRQITWRP